MSATCGSFFWSTRRENSGGIVNTPLMRPFRRSVSARALVGVQDGLERVGAAGHRAGQLAHPHGRQAAVLIDDRPP